MIASLHHEEIKQLKEKTTISLFGGVRARKWDRMVLKIKTDDPLKIIISEKSMFGVAITGQLRYSRYLSLITRQQGDSLLN